MHRNLSRARSFRPQVEALEDRSLMACVVFTSPGGVLNIIGDGADDTVSLYDNGSGGILGMVSGAGPISYTGINSVVIDTGAGNDAVTYRFTGDLQGSVGHNLNVALRTGDDTFNATFNNNGNYADFQPRALLLMKVTGEAGNDRMFLDASGGVDMHYATMKISFYGGEGDDIIGMTYAGLNDHGGVTFWAYGNQGNDQIRMSMWADPASVAPQPGGFRGIIEGNEDDDTIYFHVTAPPTVGLQNSIKGGSGRDTAYTNIGLANIDEVETIIPT